VFINNAAQGQTPGFFHELTAETVDDLVAINCASIVKATHAVLPSMLARGRGAVVNISSAGGVPVSTPLLSLYAATKTFVIQFSMSLSDEYKDKGIDVQVSPPPGITCMSSCTEGMCCCASSCAGQLPIFKQATGHNCAEDQFWGGSQFL
jgi:short-subunit dehydrogenase